MRFSLYACLLARGFSSQAVAGGDDDLLAERLFITALLTSRTLRGGVLVGEPNRFLELMDQAKDLWRAWPFRPTTRAYLPGFLVDQSLDVDSGSARTYTLDASRTSDKQHNERSFDLCELYSSHQTGNYADARYEFILRSRQYLVSPGLRIGTPSLTDACLLFEDNDHNGRSFIESLETFAPGKNTRYQFGMPRPVLIFPAVAQRLLGKNAFFAPGFYGADVGEQNMTKFVRSLANEGYNFRLIDEEIPFVVPLEDGLLPLVFNSHYSLGKNPRLKSRTAEWYGTHMLVNHTITCMQELGCEMDPGDISVKEVFNDEYARELRDNCTSAYASEASDMFKNAPSCELFAGGMERTVHELYFAGEVFYFYTKYRQTHHDIFTILDGGLESSGPLASSTHLFSCDVEGRTYCAQMLPLNITSKELMHETNSSELLKKCEESLSSGDDIVSKPTGGGNGKFGHSTLCEVMEGLSYIREKPFVNNSLQTAKWHAVIRAFSGGFRHVGQDDALVGLLNGTFFNSTYPWFGRLKASQLRYQMMATSGRSINLTQQVISIHGKNKAWIEETVKNVVAEFMKKKVDMDTCRHGFTNDERWIMFSVSLLASCFISLGSLRYMDNAFLSCLFLCKIIKKTGDREERRVWAFKEAFLVAIALSSFLAPIGIMIYLTYLDHRAGTAVWSTTATAATHGDRNAVGSVGDFLFEFERAIYKDFFEWRLGLAADIGIELRCQRGSSWQGVLGVCIVCLISFPLNLRMVLSLPSAFWKCGFHMWHNVDTTEHYDGPDSWLAMNLLSNPGNEHTAPENGISEPLMPHGNSGIDGLEKDHDPSVDSEDHIEWLAQSHTQISNESEASKAIHDDDGEGGIELLQATLKKRAGAALDSAKHILSFRS